MIAPFRRVRSQDDVVRQLQDAVGAVFQDVVSREILDGQVIEGVQITTGTPYAVSHKLSRALVGYIVIRKNADANVWDSVSAAPSSILILNSSANVTISVWVF